MTTASPTNVLIGTMLTFGLLSYSIGHTYKFDRCKCLIPRRKGLVRTTMVWLELFSATCFAVWLAGLTVIKYDLGYLYVPGYGYLSWPIEAWPEKWIRWNAALTIALLLAFSAYDAVNLEEFIFWVNMIRSVRRSNKTATSRWLSRNIMSVWILLTAAEIAVHFGTSLIGIDTLDPADLLTQNKRIYLLEGGFGFITCILSIALALIFPRFIREVKGSGGSPDILSKLTFFNSMNKMRIVFRALFCIAMLILGIDGTTKKMVVCETHISADFLFQVIMLSFIGSSIISFMLYLPVSWSGSNLEVGTTFARRRAGGTGNRHQSYFVMNPPTPSSGVPTYSGPPATTVNPKASNKGLLQQFKAQHQNETILELLRSRGTAKDRDGDQESPEQLDDDEENEFADGDSGSKQTSSVSGRDAGTADESPFEDIERGGYDHAYPAAVYHDGTADGNRAPGSTLPPALLNFQSPLEFFTGDARNSLPPRTRGFVINVAQETETHIDVDTLHSQGEPSFATYSQG